MKYLVFLVMVYFAAGFWACGSTYNELPIAALRAASVQPFPACVDWLGITQKALFAIDRLLS